MGDENPIRTLRDYSKPSQEGYRNTIELPVGNNVVPLRSDIIQLVQNGCSFHGLWSEDPNQHLKDFLKLVDSLDHDVANRERTRLHIADFSNGKSTREMNRHTKCNNFATKDDQVATLEENLNGSESNLDQNPSSSSQVKYELEKYVNYSKLNSEYLCFITQLNKNSEPKTFFEASKYSHWIDAMNDEIHALLRNDTREVTKLPKNRKGIDSKWIFKIKYKSNDEIDRYKGRLVAKGYNQKEGIAYEETFSLVVKMVSARCLLNLVVQNDWSIFQLDVNNAFLYGELVETINMKLLDGYIPANDNRVCKLKKSLYKLKQEHKQWNAKLITALIENDFSQNDIIITGNSTSEIEKFKTFIKTKFMIKDLGKLKYFLDIEVIDVDKGICINQRKYVLDLLSDYDMLSCKPAKTSFQSKLVITNEASENYHLLDNISDDPIDAINHMMSFLTAVGRQTSFDAGTIRPTLQEQVEVILGNKGLLFVTTARGKDTCLNSALNRKGNGMIHGLRIKCFVGSRLNALAEVNNHDNVDNNLMNQVCAELCDSEQFKCTVCRDDRLKQTLYEHLKEKESLMQTVTLLKNDFKKEESRNIDREIALEKRIKQLDNIVFKRDQSAQTVHYVLMKPQFFYGHTTKQALGFQNPFYLKKAQQLEPKLYDGNVIKNTSAIVIPDSEETLMLDEGESNQENNSVNSSDPTLSSRPTKVEVPKELPKVSMVNTSQLTLITLHTQEEAAILRERVEQGKSQNPLNESLDSACKYTKQIQELLIIVGQTCPSINNSGDKLVVVIPKNKDKRVRFTKPVTSSGNTNTKTASSSNLVSNKPMLSSTGVKPSTSASGSQPSGNTKKDKIQRTPSSTQKNKVEAHLMTVKSILKNKNHAIEPKGTTNVYHSKLNANSEPLCVKCRPNCSMVQSNSEMIMWQRYWDMVIIRLEMLRSQGFTTWKDLDITYSLLDNSVIRTLKLLFVNTPASYASKTKSWLWHRHLSHLNFGTINHKKKPHIPKSEDTNQEKLYLLHMDLCGLMRVASVNGKKYILVIVDDYSRFTWVKCLRTDNGTEFVNQTLRGYYEKVGISHETSVARSPHQNGVVERRNHTLIEAARIMLIYTKASYSYGQKQWLPHVTPKIVPSVDYPASKVVAPIHEVIAPVPAASTGGSPSLTNVDQDAPSPSHSQTPET
ncbi:retrovirus-related pol polyprotein from transposon TNT 1-94 [Tanacetum coccineum]|uniref:Retrovirus-related pol polyprotein from transposon TNT 1-94 n=1 Tax=Tanacetum coccineum TaxID=301880 RepID=A0ABQ5HEI0_9ASTR